MTRTADLQVRSHQFSLLPGRSHSDVAPMCTRSLKYQDHRIADRCGNESPSDAAPSQALGRVQSPCFP